MDARLDLLALRTRGSEKQSQAVHHDNDGAALVSDDSNRERNPPAKREGHEHDHSPKGYDQVLPDNCARPLAKPECS